MPRVHSDINTVGELAEWAAREGVALSPRYVTDTHGVEWLAIDTTQGDFWFWADYTVMQVL